MNKNFFSGKLMQRNQYRMMFINQYRMMFTQVAIGNGTSANGGLINHGAWGRRLALRHWLVIWSDHDNTVCDWLSVFQT